VCTPDLDSGLEDNLNHQVTSVPSPKNLSDLTPPEVHAAKKGRLSRLGDKTIKSSCTAFILLYYISDRFLFIILVCSWVLRL